MFKYPHCAAMYYPNTITVQYWSHGQTVNIFWFCANYSKINGKVLKLGKTHLVLNWLIIYD